MTTNGQSISNELFHNRQTFLRYNQHRINEIFSNLNPEDRKVFTLIPRLLHINQKGLPGFITDQVPCGIQGFPLSYECRFAQESLFPDVHSQPNQNLNPFIECILLMGSAGSIAQNVKSDLDFTVFINKYSVSPEKFDLFNLKLKLIEEWAWKTYGLEIHFFSNDINEVKENIFGESDSESTGSAQAKLLKEEMYRTAVITAGKIPFWWVVPLKTDDKQYEKLYQMVNTHQTLLNSHEFLDIGNVDDISQGEFFGGSIWALIKSFKAPFKTLIKMALLEEYMFNTTASNLLCHEIKGKVFGGVPFDQIDPYINLFERVEGFFKSNKTTDELEVLRTAFYLKVGKKLTVDELKYGSSQSKKIILIDLINSWNWPRAKVDYLNDYLNWQMMEKVALGNRVNKILMNSYKNISEANQKLEPGESLITEKDTNLLGRKLFSFYRKTVNKVENLFALVDGKTSEKELTFLHHKPHPRDSGEWYLIRGKTLDFIEQIPKAKIIKKASTLQFLIAFTCFNRLYSEETFLLLRSEDHSIKDGDLRKLLQDLSGFLSLTNVAEISNKELLNDSYVKQLYLIIDFGNPVPKEVTIGNIKECRNLEEYTQFVQKRLERVHSVIAIYLTSWGELFCKTFSGLMCLSRCLSELQPQILSFSEDHPEFFKVFIPGSRLDLESLSWVPSYIHKSLIARTLDTNKLISI